MAEERTGSARLRNKAAVEFLRHVFDRAWPVDRKPLFRRLVRAIDDLDRRQRQRRKSYDNRSE